jgi:hypothetical protein
VHIRLIELSLPEKINYDYGETSWVWITVCTAFEYLLQDILCKSGSKSEFEDIVNSVLNSQIAESSSEKHIF